VSHRHVVTLIYGTPASNLSSEPTLDSDPDTLQHTHQAVWSRGELVPMVEGSDDPFTGHFHVLVAGESQSGPDDMPVHGPPLEPYGYPGDEYPEGGLD
jgi:hypothetical protein